MEKRPVSRMSGPNRFKLGLFGLNCSGGLTMTTAPERWEASMENNIEAARLADAAGLEFMLPIGRWHGYGGQTDTAGESYETLTWATALLGATRGISVFGTVHVALINPILAAKQMVTADHVGHGRFGLNIVSGWNVGEHNMFGVAIRDHDDRYAYAEEWITIVKRIWSEPEPFDFAGRFFSLTGVISNPKPYGGERPLLISAGNSFVGRAFAARHADCLFTSIRELNELDGKVADLKAVAGSEARVFASGHVITGPTEKEARDYYNFIVHETGDWEAAEHTVAIRTRGGSSSGPKLAKMKEAIISGTGTYPVVGSYDRVADVFADLARRGIDGMAIGLVNYVADFPALRDEILPRMERHGIREPVRAT